MPRSSWLLLDGLARGRAFAPLVIRAFLGTFLVYMAQDNVLDAARMEEFAVYLADHGVPAPGVCARVSAWAQFVGGLLIFAGALTRLAALVLVVNFAVALVVVHARLSFRTYLEPCAMLATALFLLLNGAGPWSVDALLARADER